VSNAKDLYKIQGEPSTGFESWVRAFRNHLFHNAFQLPEQTPDDEPSPRRRGLLGQSPLGYIEGAWAEDRATRGRDPSADPGAKTGEGGTMPPHGLPGLARKR
jgi:hypothetical protein